MTTTNRRKPAAIAYVDMPDGSVYPIRYLLASGKTNTKMRRNDGRGYLTLGLSLLPHKLGGVGNLCPFASKLCIKLCLLISGRTDADTESTRLILRARLARTLLYFQDRALFLAMLHREIGRAAARARRKGLQLIVRLNVFSDIDWAHVHPDLIGAFPEVIFYGYTKNPRAMTRSLNGTYPPNYHLTFSRSETNEAQSLDFLAASANVAVVFDTKYTAGIKRPLPATWRGYPVIDGDETDLRFLDPRGVVVGLRAKGRARRAGFAKRGFVIPTDGDHVAPIALD